MDRSQRGFDKTVKGGGEYRKPFPPPSPGPVYFVQPCRYNQPSNITISALINIVCNIDLEMSTSHIKMLRSALHTPPPPTNQKTVPRKHRFQF